jgi:altronate dehydratase small subunit
VEPKIALKVDEKDNVGTIFSNGIKSGMRVEIKDHVGNQEIIIVRDDIPYGHKIALTDIKAGEHILKYGESIGAASRNIAAGEYVHVHNMVSLRGRGDL